MTVWAFLDESGDPDIDVEKKGTTTHFALAAVVAEEANLDELRAKIEGLREKHFQRGPMKSKTVGNNLKRRLEILGDLDATGYRTLGLVVDKRRLDRESGLRFRASFMKFISRFMYTKLSRAYPSLHARADEHGTPAFMEGYKRYLHEHCKQLSLTDTGPVVELVEDKSEVLVQAADLVAGSLRVAYSDETSEEAGRAILATLRRASLGLQEWPAVVRTAAALRPANEGEGVDEIVRVAGERTAYAFLAEVAEKDDDVSRMQVEVLQELIGAARFEESGCISRDALAERLRERGYADCTSEYLRRNLIPPMRDREVLIVSSAKGYSIASSLADFDAHLERMEEVVRPILRRVQTMQALLKLASVGKLDLMEQERFRYLRGLLEAHDQHALTSAHPGTEGS